MSSKRAFWSAVALVCIVLALHAATVQRVRNEIRNDQRISSAISRLADVIDNQVAADGEAPESLDDVTLDDDLEADVQKHGVEYEKTTKGYNLCAEFKREADGQTSAGPFALTFDYNEPSVDPYVHEAGGACFEYNASAGNTYPENYFQDFDFNNPEIDFSDPIFYENPESFQIR